MTHAYKSLEDGQIVVSEEPREDLEALARWESIDAPEAPVPEKPTEIPEGEPADKWAVSELKAYAIREEIDLGEAKNKGEYLKAIADALDAKRVAAEEAAKLAGDAE